MSSLADHYPVQKIEQKEFQEFNIMQEDIKKEDAEKVITEEMIKHVKNHTESHSTRLLSFLALINSYVPGSHLSKLLCEEFLDQTEQLNEEENHTLETIMKPFMDLIVIFSEGEQEVQCIRLAHPMIADACLQMFTESKLTRFDIAVDFLNSLVKGKESNYGHICRIMLVIRIETREGKQLFSRLILDMIRERNNNQCIRLLELASDLFSTGSYYTQALARFYCITVNDYSKAVYWAKKAIKQNPDNSCIMDTLGQVHKKHLSKISLKAGETFKTLLPIAQSAFDAFKDVEKVAENDPENNTKFNYSGLFGFLQVCKIIHPKSVEDSDQECSKFISGLKGDVETNYDFFEWYLAFSRPRIEKENPYYLRRDAEMCYTLYFKQGKSNKMTMDEKKMKSFGGLLNFLKSDTNVLKENLSAHKNPQSEHEIVLYILANVILSQSGEPCEKAEDLQARLQELWATVTAYIKYCIDDVTVTKTITTRANRKPWMTAEVRGLLKPEMKRSDQEIKRPSKQQEPICPVASKMQNGHMEIKSIINSQTAEIHGACGKAFRPSLTTSPRHRPVTTTHPSQMHSTTFIHGLKCRTTHLHKNCPHLPATRHSVCLQPT